VKTQHITDTINRALDSAGLLRSTTAGAHDVRGIIDRAL
jgi:hypothetical protein